MRHVLLTHSSLSYKELADLTEPSKRAWCERWGWEYVRVETPDITPWHRPMMWRHQLQNCDLMLFMGADTLITNVEIPPIISTTEIIIAADGNGINNDVFFMRSTSDTLQFCLEVMRYNFGDDQQAMSAVLSGSCYEVFKFKLAVELNFGGLPASPRLIRAIKGLYIHGPSIEFVEQRVLNAYPQELYGRPSSEPYGWQPGDFCAHMPGVGMAERIAWVKKVLDI